MQYNILLRNHIIYMYNYIKHMFHFHQSNHLNNYNLGVVFY